MNAESNSGYDCPVKINKIYKHSLYVKANVLSLYISWNSSTLSLSRTFLFITSNSTCTRKSNPVGVLDNEEVFSSN